MFLKKLNIIFLPNKINSLPVKYIRIFRWNPYLNLKPWFSIYPIQYDFKNKMILDWLFFIKNNQDSTLTFRRSCREGICGSCSMNINGGNTLACLKLFPNRKPYITIYPLPHFHIIKDLISDLTNFYNQYRLVKPWLITENKVIRKENFQSKQDRLGLDGLYECILCACCASSCPSYWWNYDKYLGPAVLLQSYRWILDSRDSSVNKRLKFVNHKLRLFKCHTIMNCNVTCPKNLNPSKAISFLKYYSSFMAERAR